MVTSQSLQAEVLDVLYAHYGDATFTARDAYDAIKGELPINSIVQNARDLGALLNACNLKPVGSIGVERGPYDRHKKIARWKLVGVPALATIPAQTDTVTPTRLHPRVLMVRTVLSLWEEAINRPIHARYTKSFDMAMWWLECCNWDVECVTLAINHAKGSDRPLTAMALELTTYNL